MPRFLFMRYNSNVGAFCLSAAIQNVTQYPGITSGTTIGIIQGRHPDNFQNENNMMDGADMTNAIVVLVNSGFVAGSPGNFLAERAFNYGPGEIINEGDPVYLSYGDGQRAEFNAKINRAAVAPVVPNSFFFVYCSVEVPNHAAVNHWLSASKQGEVWYITGGELGSKLIEISHGQLMDVLFTVGGRHRLGAAVVQAWPFGTSIRFDEDNFLVMPKIQLREAKSWDNETDEAIRNITPWTVVPRRTTNSRRFHTIQIVDTNGDDRNDVIDELDMRVPLSK